MIKRLHVRNFKSLRDVDLTLGPLSVLVGPNMAGKSNILDAFGFLSDLISPRPGIDGLSYALSQRAGIEEVLWRGGDEKLIAISLEEEDDENPEVTFSYELQILAGIGGWAEIQKEELKLRSSRGEIPLTLEEGGTRWTLNAKGLRQQSSGMRTRSVLENAPQDWQGQRFREIVSSWRVYHLVPPSMKERNPTAAGRKLEPHGDNLSAWIMWLQTRSPATFEKINEVLRDVFPDILGLVTWPTEDSKVHLACQERELKKQTNIWQMSDGLLCCIALLSLIYAPPKLSGGLYCIEEPENHVHPRVLSTLVKLIKQAQEPLMHTKAPKPQIILTTQSPYLVDQMSLEEIICVEKKSGETRVFRPSDKEHLRKVIEDKELGLGDVIYSGLLTEER